ncbi:unnamed protein product, partial [Iphiclides podalirius]
MWGDGVACGGVAFGGALRAHGSRRARVRSNEIGSRAGRHGPLPTPVHRPLQPAAAPARRRRRPPTGREAAAIDREGASPPRTTTPPRPRATPRHPAPPRTPRHVPTLSRPSIRSCRFASAFYTPAPVAPSQSQNWMETFFLT